jgi:hypothetical protein
MEVVNEEWEERLERVRRRALEWKSNHLCRQIILEQMEAAILEAEWRQQSCTELMMEIMEAAMLESRMKLCREVVLEAIVTGSWECLEVNRLLRETKGDGLERQIRIEDALRFEREEREWTAAMLEEERCLALRLKKKKRIQKAWRLSMEANKLARMTKMLEELSVEDMEMEVESIEMLVNEMIDIEDWAEEDDIDWQEDGDGDQVMPELKVMDSAFDARFDWESSQGGIDGRVSDPMCKMVKVMDAIEDKGMDIDSAVDARSDWKSSQGGIDGRVSDPMYKVEEYVNRDQPIPQVGSSMMEEMDVMEVPGAPRPVPGPAPGPVPGPCHHVGGGGASLSNKYQGMWP